MEQNVAKSIHDHSLRLHKQAMRFSPDSVVALYPNPPILCQHAQIPVAGTSINKRLCCCAQGQKTQFV